MSYTRLKAEVEGLHLDRELTLEPFQLRRRPRFWPRYRTRRSGCLVK